MDTQLYLTVMQFYQQYASTVDQADWSTWLDFFVEDCHYKIQPRENFDRNLPLATLSLTSKNMLKDRIYGITETIFHDPYQQTHVVSAPLITAVEGDVVEAEANYSVFRTKNDGIAVVFNVGRYIDRLQQTDEGLKILSRTCVFDNDMILNSIIYPI